MSKAEQHDTETMKTEAKFLINKNSITDAEIQIAASNCQTMNDMIKSGNKLKGAISQLLSMEVVDEPDLA